MLISSSAGCSVKSVDVTQTGVAGSSASGAIDMDFSGCVDFTAARIWPS